MFNKIQTILQAMLNAWQNWTNENIRYSSNNTPNDDDGNEYEEEIHYSYKKNTNPFRRIMDFIFSPIIYLVKTYNKKPRISVAHRSPTSNILCIIFTLLLYKYIYNAFTDQDAQYISIGLKSIFSITNIGLSYYFDISLMKVMGLMGVLILMLIGAVIVIVLVLIASAVIFGNSVYAELGGNGVEIIRNIFQQALYIDGIVIKSHHLIATLILVVRFILWATYICILYRYLIVFPTKDIRVYKENN